jgi:hypothetical protein
VIGGASVETVRHAPWKPHPAAAQAPPVIRPVSPNASVPAPREQIPVAAVTHVRRQPVRHVAKKLAKLVHTGQHGRALGRQKHLGGSVAASQRPVHPVHPVHPVRAHTHVAKPKPPRPKQAQAQAHGNGKKP